MPPEPDVTAGQAEPDAAPELTRERPPPGRTCTSAADCDDSLLCNGQEQCTNGRCMSGVAVNCDDSDACTGDLCIEQSQTTTCQHTLLECPGDTVCNPESGCSCEADEPCADGDPCTINDICLDGECRGEPAACDDHNSCTEDMCLPDLGCVHVDTADGTPCDAGTSCIENASCDSGSCEGTPLDCADGDPCTDDSCSSGQCANVVIPGCPPPEPHDGGNPGDPGGVDPGPDCGDCDDSDPCTTDICDNDGVCIHTNNSAPCDDGDPCTSDDSCSAGVCQPGPAVACDDGNPCTDDACVAGTGCAAVPNTAACANPCTPDGVCIDGSCTGTASADGEPCDDGNTCTQDDACSGGFCTGSIVDPCVPCAGSGSCDDGDPCTISDTCVDGFCQSGPSLTCDDDNACTSDSCDPAIGCVFTPTAASCDDGDACTLDDACADGQCAGTPAGNCDHPTHVVCVRPAALGLGDGSNWFNAFVELQPALAAAALAPGQIAEIWVASGTYRPDFDTITEAHTNHRGASFVLLDNVAIYGGFSGGETTRDQRAPATNLTILTGDLGIPGDTTDNSYHVMHAADVDSTSRIDGFTISGGRSDGPNLDGSGGGLLVNDASPTIANCTIENNSAFNAAGVFFKNSSALIDNCRFLNNAGIGGSANGGAINTQAGSIEVSDSLFAGNTASFGAGMMSSGASTLTNCTFFGNTATADGGGLYLFSSATVAVTNCILWDNVDAGGVDESAQIHALGGTQNVSYSCIGGLDTYSGNGNSGSDPLMVAPDTDDFRLLPSSPCIDAGDSSAITSPTDLDGLPRQTDHCMVDTGAGPAPIVDMGAHETGPCN